MTTTGPAIERIYPLSPMQQGMLFHASYTPEADVYVEQVTCVFDGDLDVAAFRRAWDAIVERHSILRTSFHSMESTHSVQVVHAAVDVPWVEEDWRGMDPAAQRERLARFLEADRARGFDPARPPLLRFALVRSADSVHQFVWTHHHLLLDGWSVSLLLGELTALYSAGGRGENAALPAARPFEDYITWLKRQGDARTQAFWRRYLGGFAAPTPLPLDQDRPVGSPSGLFTEGSELSERLTADVTDFARSHGLTIGTLIQAAWALLLGTYGGARDVVHGMTVAGRPSDLPGAEGIVGLFINTLPVRTRIRPERTTVKWLRDTQQELLDLRQFEHTSLVETRGWSDVPAGTPLFESLVVIENYPIQAGEGNDFDGVAVRDVRSAERTNYPLTLIAIPGRPLRLRLICDRERYTPQAAQTLLAALTNVLAEMAADPGRPVGELSLLSARARDELLARWAGTTTDYPRDESLHSLFSGQAAGRPDAVALVDGDRQLTYAVLAEHSARTASGLRRAGVRPGARVGVFLDRSAELVIALLGVTRTGAAYVPLDPSYPPERVEFMLADGQVDVVVTVSSLRSRLPGGWSVLCLDDLGEPADGASDGPTVPGGEAPAYVMYTSGSTGRPKGVVVPQRAVVRLVRDTDYVALRQDDRIAFASNTSFDAATFEIWGALLNGATLVVVGGRRALDPIGYGAYIRRQALTTLFMTPALFNQFAVAAPDAFATMRQVLVGGEAADPGAVRTVLAAGPPRRLLNAYGPTESTTFATWHEVRAVAEGAVTVPIGRALANTTTYVLDDAGRPVPPGAVGRLFLGGDGLAHGYWDRSALTADRFLPDPFRDEPGARMYRTGDLARARPDGGLVFAGRTDHQVKLRGYRIEPGEIEVVLRAHPAVAEAVVTIREDSPGDRRLVAYVAADKALVPELRDHCARRLPDYMVPAAFVAKAVLPLTPNGKIDRAALPAPEFDRPDPGTRYLLPRPGLEELLAELWAQVLRVTRVGRDDNFFALGGHSLDATRLQTRLRSALSVDVPLRAVFESATFAELAAQVEAARRREGEPAAEIPPLRPRDGSTPPPLSFPQQRLWFLEQWEPGTPLYHISGAVRLHGRLDVVAFRAAWNAVGRRHEALRTHIAEVRPGEPRQIVSSGSVPDLPVVDLSGLPVEKREEVVRALVRRTIRTPFDLTTGPLWRVAVLRLGPDDHVLALCLHHLIADGESIEVLLDELGAQYRAGGQASLPPLPIQYGDYAVWQHSWLTGDRLAAELAYWRGRLAGLATTTLPTDRPRTSAPGPAASVSVQLEAELDHRLRRLARDAGVTAFMALFAGYAVSLGQTLGVSEAVVGTPTANRAQPELENAVGFFVNTLVLRLDLSGDPTFRELLGRAREVCLGAYTHQAVPFEKVVHELAPERRTTHLPFFQTWFVVQEMPSVDRAFPGLRLEPVDSVDQPPRYDLRLHAQRSPAGLRAVFKYKTDLFDEATIARMARTFEHVVDIVAAEPDTRLSALTRRLSAAEEHTRQERRKTVTLASLHRLKNARREPIRDQGDDQGVSI
jgi:amino acid adenylation domain-containing protein